MCGGLIYDERARFANSDLGVKVDHGCLTEGGNSFLRVFSWELLIMTTNDFLELAN